MLKKTLTIFFVVALCSAYSTSTLAACKLAGIWYVTTTDVEINGWTYCIIKLRANGNVLPNRSICINDVGGSAVPTGDADLEGCNVFAIIQFSGGVTSELVGRMQRNGKLISGVGISSAAGSFTFTAIK